MEEDIKSTFSYSKFNLKLCYNCKLNANILFAQFSNYLARNLRYKENKL